MNHEAKDAESYETKNEERWVLWNIKERTFSPMKLKREDVESYEPKNKGRWDLWN